MQEHNGVVKIEKCRYCGESPCVADVGGNNPMFEVACVNPNCKSNLAVLSKKQINAILQWNYEQVK